MHLIKNNIILIIISFVLITVFIIRPFVEKDYDEKVVLSTLKKETKEVLKKIEKDAKTQSKETIYYINNQIIERFDNNEKNEIATLKSNIGEGTVLVRNKKIVDYQVKKDEYCINYVANKIKIKKGRCEIIGKIDTAANLIEKTSTKEELVDDTKQTGLDTKYDFASKKYFRGTNPDNYLILENTCYRIISIANNNTVKVIYDGLVEDGTCKRKDKNTDRIIGLMAWNNDKVKKVTWEESYLNYKLQRSVEENELDMVSFKVKLDNTKIEDASWYIGIVDRYSKSLLEIIKDERSKEATEEMTTNRKIKLGLLNVSDYLKVSCKKGMIDQNIDCRENNYLYNPTYDWWLISPIHDESNEAWQVTKEGNIVSLTIPYSRELSYSGIRPVFYLKSNVKLKGTGTIINPYVVQ